MTLLTIVYHMNPIINPDADDEWNDDDIRWIQRDLKRLARPWDMLHIICFAVPKGGYSVDEHHFMAPLKGGLAPPQGNVFKTNTISISTFFYKKITIERPSD